MKPAYMPFTYLSESTARILSALVGPVVIYQPMKKNIPESLTQLASQGLVEIRTPMTQDDDRLHAALSEFTDWARMNPGKSTPGAGFIGARQGEIPFFDDTTINRIRCDIKRFKLPGDGSDRASDIGEAGFSARLFLALAQDNDRATDHLDHDLNRFKILEKDFLASLMDADEVDFNRQILGGTIWREDPGKKLTAQRIRAWATLAAADADPPEMMITTSMAVIDILLESHADVLGLEKLAGIRVAVQDAGSLPRVGRVLTDLAVRDSLPSADLASFKALAADADCGSTATVSLFIAANRTPATVIRRMAPANPIPSAPNGTATPLHHTLIVLVED